jgi:hypothetical protein
MIKPNDEITIVPAANGFVVRPTYTRGEVFITSEQMVFQSMSALVNFLNAHYSHRDTNVPRDAEVSAS